MNNKLHGSPRIPAKKWKREQGQTRVTGKPYLAENIDLHNDRRIERKQNNVTMDRDMKHNNLEWIGR
jgi:hypothetical protein